MNKTLALYRDRNMDAGCNPIGSSFMLKMKRKTLFYTLFLSILLLTLSSIEIRAEGREVIITRHVKVKIEGATLVKNLRDLKDVLGLD